MYLPFHENTNIKRKEAQITCRNYKHLAAEMQLNFKIPGFVFDLYNFREPVI